MTQGDGGREPPGEPPPGGDAGAPSGGAAAGGPSGGAAAGGPSGGAAAGVPSGGAAAGVPSGGAAAGGPGAAAAEPAALLGEVSRLRRQARAVRHGYWFPLVLFGLLTCASVPFYVQPTVRRSQGIFILSRQPLLPVFGGFATAGWRGYLPYYWLAALAAGLVLTGLWYRRHGRKVGLVTPARGYLITGAALIALGVLPWFVWWISGRFAAYLWLLPGDLIVRGTFPFVIIAAGFWVLTLAERSWGLFAATAVYTAAALLSSLYDIENVPSGLGWYPVAQSWLAPLPNVLLPALILLVAGGVAFAAQRRPRRLA